MQTSPQNFPQSDGSRPVVIITGASRGLGAAAARSASQLGADIVLSARTEEDLVKLADKIQNEGGHALVVPADVSLPDDCRRIVAKTITHFNRIDAVINNAGILEPVAPLSRWDPEGWKMNFDINLMGAVMLVQAALPYLRENFGRVINVSSGAAVNVVSGWGAYCVSKAALNHFSRVLAVEEEHITTLSFRPGVVDTKMQETIRNKGSQGMPENDHKRFVNLHENGQLLPPELPARALGVLSLFAPPKWSGEFIAWDDEKVKEIVSKYFNT